MANEIWIAMAELAFRAGDITHAVQNSDLVDKVSQLFGDRRSGISVHVSQHLVAQKRLNTGYNKCYLSVAGRGWRRLFLPGDEIHESRHLNPQRVPERNELPDDHRGLLDWFVQQTEGGSQGVEFETNQSKRDEARATASNYITRISRPREQWLERRRKDWSDKNTEILEIIRTRIREINERYRRGPELYFYKRVIHLRRNARNLGAFLDDDYNLEMLYATLVSWDMNSRGAKMKYYDDFKANIMLCRQELEVLDKVGGTESFQGLGGDPVTEPVMEVYDKLALMVSGGRLVSNSKFLHFLFPDLLMPMDGKNTLEYFYGNTSESPKKYSEIISVSLDIMSAPLEWKTYLDTEWNQTVPKMIDNAILLLVGKSVK